MTSTTSKTLQPLVYTTFSDAKRAVKLLAGAVSAIEVDRAALRRKAAGSFLTMTELADTLVREEGLSFKAAHRLVAQTVKRVPGIETPAAEIVQALLAVAEEHQQPLRTPRETLLRALSPEHFVAVRTVLGGPAPEQVAEFLRRQKERAAADQQTRRKRLARRGISRRSNSTVAETAA
ncbi:MAG: hypothetical protein U0X75_20560 [Acidobacteriota bacterium]